MMGLWPRGVKPAPVRAESLDPSLRRLVGGNGGEYYWRSGGLSNASRNPQIGLVSTSRMKAAPLSQASSASSAELALLAWLSAAAFILLVETSPL